MKNIATIALEDGGFTVAVQSVKNMNIITFDIYQERENALKKQIDPTLGIIKKELLDANGVFFITIRLDGLKDTGVVGRYCFNINGVIINPNS